MNRISLAAFAAVALFGIAPAQADNLKCDDGVMKFFERLQINGSAMTKRGDALADIMRKTVRAYDACKSGDDISLRGLWDEIEKDHKKS